MKDLIAFLNSLGFNITLTENPSPLLLFALCILVFSLISLFCIINIIMYLLVVYVSDNKKVLEIVSKHAWVLKIFNLYKQTRIVYLVGEFIFLIFVVCSMIWLCYRIVNGLM